MPTPASRPTERRTGPRELLGWVGLVLLAGFVVLAGQLLWRATRGPFTLSTLYGFLIAMCVLGAIAWSLICLSRSAAAVFGLFAVIVGTWALIDQREAYRLLMRVRVANETVVATQRYASILLATGVLVVLGFAALASALPRVRPAVLGAIGVVGLVFAGWTAVHQLNDSYGHTVRLSQGFSLVTFLGFCLAFGVAIWWCSRFPAVLVLAGLGLMVFDVIAARKFALLRRLDLQYLMANGVITVVGAALFGAGVARLVLQRRSSGGAEFGGGGRTPAPLETGYVRHPGERRLGDPVQPYNPQQPIQF